MVEIEQRKPTRDVVRDSWRGSGDAPWIVISALVAALVLAPVTALAVIGSAGPGDLWPHLIANVLPTAFRVTALLLLGVGILVIAIGAGSAWLVTAYDFPGRRMLEWALLLPLAVPTYIIAFAYLDILHPIGPVRSTLRGLLGLAEPGSLWFPEIRSLAGCIVLFGLVLYPYVYLSTRALFAMQAAGLVDAAETLGARRRPIFFRIALPLARPAIAVGTSLALMEALNDIGASEFLGVRTLTVSIYATWINRSNLAGAAEIALLMLVIVVALILIERWARRRQTLRDDNAPVANADSAHSDRWRRLARPVARFAAGAVRIRDSGKLSRRRSAQAHPLHRHRPGDLC